MKKKIKKNGRLLFLLLCILLIILGGVLVYYLVYSGKIFVNYKEYSYSKYSECLEKINSGERNLICNIENNCVDNYKIKVNKDTFVVYVNNEKVISNNISVIKNYYTSLNDYPNYCEKNNKYIIFSDKKISLIDKDGSILDEKENVYPTVYFVLSKSEDINKSIMEDLNITVDGTYIFTYVNNESNKEDLYNYFSCYYRKKLDVYKLDDKNNKIVLVKENIDGSALTCTS